MGDGKKKPRVVRPASSGTPKKVTSKFNLFGAKRAAADEKKKSRVKSRRKY